MSYHQSTKIPKIIVSFVILKEIFGLKEPSNLYSFLNVYHVLSKSL